MPFEIATLWRILPIHSELPKFSRLIRAAECNQSQQKCDPAGRLVGMTGHAVDFVGRNDEPVDFIYSECNDRKHDAQCNVSPHSGSRSFPLQKAP